MYIFYAHIFVSFLIVLLAYLYKRLSERSASLQRFVQDEITYEESKINE